MKDLASAAASLAGRVDAVKTRLEDTADKVKGTAIKGALGWLVLQALVAASVVLVLGGGALALSSVVPLSAALAGVGAVLLAGVVTIALVLARPRRKR